MTAGRHVVKFHARGWRCSCGEWMHNRDRAFVHDSAEKHAFDRGGVVEYGGEQVVSRAAAGDAA